MRVYIITIPRNTGRLLLMKQMLLTNGFSDIHCFEGIDGKNINNKLLLQQRSSRLCSKICTDAIIGCGLSHMFLWDHVAHDDELADDEPVLLLEDDTWVLGNIFSMLEPCISSILRSQDCVFQLSLFGVFRKNTTLLPLLYREEGKYKQYCVNSYLFNSGLGALVTTRRMCRRMSSMVTEVSYHIDTQLYRALAQQGIAVLTIEPNIVRQLPFSESSIASTNNYFLSSWSPDSLTYALTTPVVRTGRVVLNAGMMLVMIFFLFILLVVPGLYSLCFVAGIMFMDFLTIVD